jgi:hypothetical protein
MQRLTRIEYHVLFAKDKRLLGIIPGHFVCHHFAIILPSFCLQNEKSEQV